MEGPLQFASARLRANKDVALVAVAADGRALKFVDPALNDDKEVALQAVSTSGSALEFASDRFR